jgi:ATP-dependent phosphoenolpyruvate carboxykinase
MPLKHTRAMIAAALDGSLEAANRVVISLDVRTCAATHMPLTFPTGF